MAKRSESKGLSWQKHHRLQPGDRSCAGRKGQTADAPAPRRGAVLSAGERANRLVGAHGEQCPGTAPTSFFPAGMPAQKIEDTIVKALEMYRKRERERER